MAAVPVTAPGGRTRGTTSPPPPNYGSPYPTQAMYNANPAAYRGTSFEQGGANAVVPWIMDPRNPDNRIPGKGPGGPVPPDQQMLGSKYAASGTPGYQSQLSPEQRVGNVIDQMKQQYPELQFLNFTSANSNRGGQDLFDPSLASWFKNLYGRDIDQRFNNDVFKQYAGTPGYNADNIIQALNAIQGGQQVPNFSQQGGGQQSYQPQVMGPNAYQDSSQVRQASDYSGYAPYSERLRLGGQGETNQGGGDYPDTNSGTGDYGTIFNLNGSQASWGGMGNSGGYQTNVDPVNPGGNRNRGGTSIPPNYGQPNWGGMGSAPGSTDRSGTGGYGTNPVPPPNYNYGNRGTGSGAGTGGTGTGTGTGTTPPGGTGTGSNYAYPGQPSNPNASNGYIATPGFNSGGGYFAGGPPQTDPGPTGGLQFPSPRSPLYNQNIGPSLLAAGPGVNPNANFGQSWQNYSNPYDMMYNQYIGAQFGPQQQALWNQIGSNIGTFQNNYQNYNSIADAYYNPQNYNDPNSRSNAYYTPDEARAMIREPELLSGQTTPDEYAATFYSPGEQQAIMGNPYEAANYFNDRMAGAYNDQDIQEGRSFDALANSDQNIRGIGNNYAGYGNAALSQGMNDIRGAAYNPDLKAQTGTLSLSDQFNKDYNYGQPDIADLENLAATTAGKHIRGQYDDVERRAAAEGNTSPLALASLKSRLYNDAAAEAADAATNARVQGRGLQLSTMANKEGMRVGAEQAKEGIRGQAAQNAAGLQTNAENSILNNRLGFGQNLANLQSGNEQFLSGQRLGTYGNLGAQRQNLNTYTAGQGGNFITQGDTNASNRASNIAGQRTTQQSNNNNTRYAQNYGTQNALSQGYGNVANQRLGANQEQRGYYAGQAGANQSALQNATNAGTNYWSNWNNAGQNAANSYGSYDLNRRNQQLQQQVAMWNRQYMGVPNVPNINVGG